MIEIDPLYILLLAEALVLEIGLSIYLIGRLKKMRSSAERKAFDLRQSIEKLIEEDMQQLKKIIEGTDQGRENLAAREMYSFRLQFLKGAYDGLKKEGVSIENLWGGIYRNYDGIIKILIQNKKEAIAEGDTLREKLGNAAGTGDPEAQPEDGRGIQQAGEGAYADAMSRMEELKIRNDDLQLSLEAKTKELAAMQKKLEALEQEYLVLYKDQFPDQA
ncbi:MAG: hypothetical protein HZA17_15075 [Nitrospirae bacterium]|nr:hypothetical protein [Nitrospirota bacterium]